MKQNNITINITPRSIALFTIIPLALYFFWFVRDILFSLLIAFILMSALRPWVTYLTGKKVPRGISVVLVYLSFILFFISIISIIIPPIIIETSNLIRSLPLIFQQVFPHFEETMNFNDLTRYVPDVTNNIFGFISSVFSNTLFVVTTMFFALYFLLEENLVDRFLHHYFGRKIADKLSETLTLAERRMSSWFWGEIVLMTVVGTFSYIGLVIIGVKYALPLAVLAGLLEVVPNIGPVISAVPAIIIGFSQNYFAGFSTMVLYVIVQQLENTLIVPMVMKRAVGLNPVFTLVALLLGGRVGGILGVLLSIPILLFTETILREYLPPKKPITMV
ncbi:hypothetical protein COU87_00045 [Candidatus Roizmanbacteria bacterium CG10_big_fil_rev_8_21_14_0_10_39_12]|uniref:AI-2E family transporter n=1 Tax=Candidatus Roizmanbacteria bacterium CG10_big_fil_rev_8_21_14_0_10_39_12 TaxID=1974852 RepID=A0A2M8KQW2_9BACT|nr:MAG: hypothetical protein COU87_00045 [Candidatus Roizmanbacteria bacterium CG10_big_fil_rev_8_21_14_0_10_39_12]